VFKENGLIIRKLENSEQEKRDFLAKHSKKIDSFTKFSRLTLELMLNNNQNAIDKQDYTSNFKIYQGNIMFLKTNAESDEKNFFKDVKLSIFVASPKKDFQREEFFDKLKEIVAYIQNMYIAITQMNLRNELTFSLFGLYERDTNGRQLCSLPFTILYSYSKIDDNAVDVDERCRKITM